LPQSGCNYTECAIGSGIGGSRHSLTRGEPSGAAIVRRFVRGRGRFADGNGRGAAL